MRKRWPLGLCHDNWSRYLKGLLLILFALLFFDVWASRSAIETPEVWRAPYAFVTRFGLPDGVLILSLVIFLLTVIGMRLVPAGLWRRATRELCQVSAFVFLTIGVSGLATNILKRLIGRSRPVIYDQVGAFDFRYVLNDWTFQSFPSGHSTTAMATALVVGFLAPRLFMLVLLLALATGLSRIMLGQHYPTDIVGGYVVGIIGAFAMRNLFARRRWLFAERPDGTVRFRDLPNLRQAWLRLFQRAAA
ncbi:MAG: phosphatase PAP2 family protein [Candidatus Devosia phytovorans]|uniref:Phosphatase PAP2 family protein n=1 Tax=Candidatus Devosia phytovorans TaxID=3121372 RepID=A0AAJ6B1L2_9HYPH|nr:phosphatase PAP2 family protein [Devosia sp.]WEK06382.1 MAG: phosphatase PAP2 family protein [Devosia sp.]